MFDMCEACDTFKSENLELKANIRALKLKVNRMERMTEVLAKATKRPLMETKVKRKNITTSTRYHS